MKIQSTFYILLRYVLRFGDKILKKGEGNEKE